MLGNIYYSKKLRYESERAAIPNHTIGGADTVYTYEERVHVEDMQSDINHLRRKFKVCICGCIFPR